MKQAYLLRRFAFEADGAPVSESGSFAVDWLTDTECGAVMSVEQTTLPGLVRVLYGIASAKHLENGIVEAFGLLDVVGPEHYVIEQGESPGLRS